MYKARVITVSDRAYRGVYEDKSGPGVVRILRGHGYQTDDCTVVPDDMTAIEAALLQACADGADLILTTGGTGVSPTDVTPEATKAIIQREVPGIAEYMRMRSMELTPFAIHSRGTAGIRDKSLIINLPGSPGGALQSLNFIINHLYHAVNMLTGAKD